MAAQNFFSNIMAFLFILISILSSSALAGRDITYKTAAAATGGEGGGNDYKKLVMQQKSFIDVRDGTVLVPGLGRYYLFPRSGTNFNPFTYNPVTGNSGSSGNGIGAGTAGGDDTGRSYIPGGDDTFIPNPGVEIPNPIGGGGSNTSPP